ADLERKARSAVEHSEHDALNVEARVQTLSNELDRFEEVSQTLERIELALQRDEYPVGRRQRVDGQQAERGRAIDNHVIEGRQDRLERETESMLSLAETDQFDLGTDQIYVRRQEPQAGQGRWVDRLLGRFAPKEHMVHRGVEVGFVDAESGGGV